MAKTETKTPSVPAYKFRYYCDACTGIAFESEDRKPNPAPTHCKKCGMPLGALKHQNFINL